EKSVSAAKNSVSFRFATGMGVSPQFRVKLLVNDLCYQAVKNRVMVIFEKNARRSFIHVRDMSRAIQHGLFNENKSKVYCCGRDENNISKGELAQMIANKTGAYLHFAEIGSDPDGRDYAISHRLLEDEYGFRCNIGIEETIDELIKVIPVIKMVEQYV